MKVLLAILGIAYALCPYDLIPDFLVGPGWVDDLLLLGGLAWYLFYRGRGPYTRPQRPFGRPQAGSGERGGESQGAASEPEDDPYTILGVKRNASPNEIRKAYLQLAAKYHPDKVAHLGDEFRVLAERKFKEIQAAYRTLGGG